MTRRGGDRVRLRGLDNLVLGGITLKGTLKSRRIKCGLDSSG